MSEGKIDERKNGIPGTFEVMIYFSRVSGPGNSENGKRGKNAKLSTIDK